MNEDDKNRFFLLEQKVEKLEALINETIARSASQREQDSRKQTELLELIKLGNDCFGKDLDFAQEQIQINRDDLSRAYEIFNLVETRLKILEKHDDDARTALKPIMQEQLRVTRELMRLDDAYYHVFPDRLAQDIRLLDQLASLTSKPPPPMQIRKRKSPLEMEDK